MVYLWFVLHIICSRLGPVAIPAPPDFRTTTRQVVSALATDNAEKMASLASSRGIDVVERRRTLGPKYQWREHVTRFTKARLRGRRFRQAVHRFRDYYYNTQGTGVYEPEASTSMEDHWHRKLGPAMEGKIASGSYWYVRLVRQAGSWRVWRLELVERG